jgi:hypothetical protein
VERAGTFKAVTIGLITWRWSASCMPFTALGKQRGATVAQIDIARRLTEAIWHMLTRQQPFTPAAAGSTRRLAPDGPLWT